MTGRAPRLWGYGLFAAMVSAAGLPIYIHAPLVYAQEYGVGLAALGAVLFGLRLIDLVQDPALGWLSARLARWRAASVAVATGVIAAAMVGLFAIAPPVAPLAWFALCLTALFSAFSFLSITFYAQGVTKAADLGDAGHVRLAGWRETGALLGITLAAMAPTMLVGTGAPYASFAWGFAALCLVAAWSMAAEWGRAPVAAPSAFRPVLGDGVARRLLLVALFNAAPVAVSSTLFLFFVGGVLDAPDWAGPLLVLFFLSAAAAAPIWARLARGFGARRVLAAAMVASILTFSMVPFLGTGDVAAFAAICVITGVTIGADMTLLPALFAQRMAQIAPQAATGFGLWSFVSKFSLAFAAVLLLPLLDQAGFQANGGSPETALRLVSFLYAGVPVVLKLVALAVLLAAIPAAFQPARLAKVD